MKHLFSLVFLLLFIPFTYASNITGNITTPSTSQPISDASISLTLSQSGVDVTNTYNLATTPVICATDSQGSVKQIKRPSVSLNVSYLVSSGSLAGVYYIRYTYFNSNGSTETEPSPSQRIQVTGPNNTISIPTPTLHPQNVTHVRYYIGTVSGSEKLQTSVTVATSSVNITSYNASGAAVPTTNTTVCSLTFNDSIIPPYTTYKVAITNVSGTNVAGYPQNWYLAGSSINVASIIPVSNINARFQNPILSNPLSSYATQSINSPIDMNSHYITGIAGLVASSAGSGNIVLVGKTAISDIVTTPVDQLDVHFGVDHNLGVISGTDVGLSDGVGFKSTNDNGDLKGIGVKGSEFMAVVGTTGTAKFRVDSKNHLATVGAIGTPGIASNAGSVTLATGSNDIAGIINKGATNSTVLTLTFGSTYSTAPACTVTLRGATQYAFSATTSTSQLIITAAAFASGDSLAYQCIQLGN